MLHSPSQHGHALCWQPEKQAMLPRGAENHPLKVLPVLPSNWILSPLWVSWCWGDRRSCCLCTVFSRSDRFAFLTGSAHREARPRSTTSYKKCYEKEVHLYKSEEASECRERKNIWSCLLQESIRPLGLTADEWAGRWAVEGTARKI